MEIRARRRVFPATLLATFPAVGGLPTIVVGTAQATGKSSSEWVLTLLHEHFHQWQYSLPDYYRQVGRLGLSGGDSTGMWMLNYPFPYDSERVQTAARAWATALLDALDAAPEGRHRAVAAAGMAGRKLSDRLTPAQRRYLEFQLWQEGVARYIEYKAAKIAANMEQPSSRFRGLPDYQPYKSVAEQGVQSLRRQLEGFDLGKNRRVSFYPLGAALALLLDLTRPGWERAYAARPFALTSLLSPGE